MPRSVCYWINSVNMALHPNLSPSLMPLGNPSLKHLSTPGHQVNCETSHHVSHFSQGFSWSGSASETRLSSCCSHLTDSGHVVTAIKTRPKENSSSMKSWTLFIDHLKQILFLWSLRNPPWEHESNSLVPILTGNWREENAVTPCFSSLLQCTKHLLQLFLLFRPDTIPGSRQSRR